MAPIRRYLRITKYSVLEVRIYLENPTAQTWLLNPRDPVLPRIVQAVRPLVLPKLREENERAKGKGKGKKQRAVKDVVVEGLHHSVSSCPRASSNKSTDDFEVSIFFTELKTRHSLLTKQKAFSEKPKMKSNSNRLTGWLESTTENPVQLDDENDDEDDDSEESINIRIESDDEDNTGDVLNKHDKRSREDSEDGLFIGDEISEDEGFQVEGGTSKRRRLDGLTGDGDEDDKKKLGINTSYDGFSIYGRILCLLVKRRGNRSKGRIPGAAADETGQQMLEGWISTQAAAEQILDDD